MMLGAAKTLRRRRRAGVLEPAQRTQSGIGTGAIVRASWLPANVAAAIGELKSCAATSGVVGIEMLGRAAVGSGLVRIDGRGESAGARDRAAAAIGGVRQRRAAAGLAGAEVARRRLGRLGRASAAVCVAETRVRSAGHPQRLAGVRYERVRGIRRRSIRRSRALIDACVHCGFCLPSCPTYAALGRGDGLAARAHLPDEGGPRRAHGDDAGVRRALRRVPRLHGVRDRLPVRRAVRAAHRSDARPDRAPVSSARSAIGCSAALIFALFPFPGRLRIALLPLASASPLGRIRETGMREAERQAGCASGLAPQRSEMRAPPRDARARAEGDVAIALRVAAGAHARERPAARLTVGLLTGCVQRVIFPHVNQATVNVLAAEGCDVVAPAARAAAARWRCTPAGSTRRAPSRAAPIEAFDRAGIDRIVVNAAGCGSSMKEYGELLADDPRGRRGRGRFQRECATSPRCSSSSARRERRGTRSRCASPITTRVTWRTRRASASRRAICCDRFPASSSCRSRNRRSAAAAPASTTWSSPMPRSSSASARPATSRASSRISSRPRTRAACSRSAGAARQQQTWSVVHPIELLDAAIRGKGVQEL